MLSACGCMWFCVGVCMRLRMHMCYMYMQMYVYVSASVSKSMSVSCLPLCNVPNLCICVRA